MDGNATVESCVAEGMEIVTIKDKRVIQDTHSYSCRAYKESNGACDSSPNTPDKKLSKKARKEQMQVSSEPSLADLQDNIIRVITAKINERADQTDEAVKHNTLQIEGLKKSLDFCYQEVFDLKKENATMKLRVEQMQKKLCEVEQKANDTDRYSRRYNLRLYGVVEERDENIKSKVKGFCSAAVPGSDGEAIVAAVDVVHRIGRIDGSGKKQFPRPVIVRFASRSARDAFWKGSKNNEFLKNKGVQVKEDLTADDRAARARLWPFIEKARKNGERAYLVGIKAFVNGKEIKG